VRDQTKATDAAYESKADIDHEDRNDGPQNDIDDLSDYITSTAKHSSDERHKQPDNSDNRADDDKIDKQLLDPLD